ncbi:MAG: TonB-dependent receptor plug domain-containing protein, partial [Acidobacteria bacterium]|nr:TonB-dependent receptor plug domain-containing protein [Acidobacteriota bacterium]
MKRAQDTVRGQPSASTVVPFQGEIPYMRTCVTVRLFAIFMLGFVPAVNVWAQTATATLAGTVVDDSGAVIPDVVLTVVKVDTAVERRTTANREGSFTFPFLPPGRYTVVARRDGFAPSELNDVVLNVGDNIALRIALKIGTVTDEVTVVADARSVTRSPGISNVIDRGFVENQPLNGRSFQSLITLSPGVVVTSAASVGSQGQFSVNGQRPSANYVTVDGVSANFSSSGAANLYEHAGGGLPALSAL